MLRSNRSCPRYAGSKEVWHAFSLSSLSFGRPALHALCRKTVYGISQQKTYQGTIFEPLFGTGQGSGASLSAWLTLVFILLQTLDRLVPNRINFSCPRRERLSADAFVDDTYLGFTSASQSLSFDSAMVDKWQTIAQTWEHLLHLSGGKLNLSNFSWYILRWEWEKGCPVIRPMHPTDPTIRLQQGSSIEQTTIQRSALDKSHRMLGVLLNPLGDFGNHIRSQ